MYWAYFFCFITISLRAKLEFKYIEMGLFGKTALNFTLVAYVDFRLFEIR